MSYGELTATVCPLAVLNKTASLYPVDKYFPEIGKEPTSPGNAFNL